MTQLRAERDFWVPGSLQHRGQAARQSGKIKSESEKDEWALLKSKVG